MMVGKGGRTWGAGGEGQCWAGAGVLCAAGGLKRVRQGIYRSRTSAQIVCAAAGLVEEF